MARQSVLSPIADRRQDLDKKLSASDRRLMDEYFTGLREMEQKLAQSLEKPAAMPSCTVPGQVKEAKPSTVIDDVETNTIVFGRLLAYAMACDQTRVFNAEVGSQGLRHAGSTFTWHTATHEEATDEKLGYQKEVYAFVTGANKIFAEFLRSLDGMKEGPGTVLDRTIVLWQTDHGDARNHSLENVPLMTVGGAGGRFKTGAHISLPGDPYARVALTVQQAMGVPISSWGDRSNQTSKTVTEMLA